MIRFVSKHFFALCGFVSIVTSCAIGQSLPTANEAGCPEATSFKPVLLKEVTDSKALGYVNNPKFYVDRDGVAYLSVRTQDSSTGMFNDELLRFHSDCKAAETLKTNFLQDMDGVTVNNDSQRVASIAPAPNGDIDMVWYGSEYAASSVYFSHQIHSARFAHDASLTILNESLPLDVTGFSSVPGYGQPPYTSSSINYLWQEHSAIAEDEDGRLHVVWEARDAQRLSSKGLPIAGVAYMTRSKDGVWSSHGETGTPPYLSVTGSSANQSRPNVLVGRDGVVHVLCYGAITGSTQEQILYGQIVKGVFSGWSAVASDSYDQRHVSAVIDEAGRIHAVWREGLPAGPVVVKYSVRNRDGKWSDAVQISTTGKYASTPVVSVEDGTVRAAWIEWTPGFVNSAGQVNNGISASGMSDDDTVEGQLMFAGKEDTRAEFGAPVQLIDGISSYPNFARGEGSMLAWTTGQPCSNEDCVQLYVSRTP